MPKLQRYKTAQRVYRLHLLAAFALLPVGAVAVVRHAYTVPVNELTGGADGSHARRGQLDPNTAPWWELTSLPGIGETRAKAIVSYRAQTRRETDNPEMVVFRHAHDLQVIKGIGPKTTARIAPYLRFLPR
ncbi:MAG: helix-hairpin-helix domain-containing protein [Phycisphaerae bacterium]|nr:helix-hairpin-helix domain-containing protein [Phycisphaerae bacterium]